MLPHGFESDLHPTDRGIDVRYAFGLCNDPLMTFLLGDLMVTVLNSLYILLFE